MGYWWNVNNSGYYSNASVSPDLSAVQYGVGNGSSSYENNWYTLPNITGLNPNNEYVLSFRLASYRFTSANATRGVDVGDYVEVQASTDGEISYKQELRITGNNNAYWDYNTNGVIYHFANGSFNASLASAGGDVYQSGAGNQTGVGYSMINLSFQGIDQLAIDIFARTNAAGEEWWIDNIELIEIEPIVLPVEMVYFEGKSSKGFNIIKWQTASEYNSDYFAVERSETGNFDDKVIVASKKSAGNSTLTIDYTILDTQFNSLINYYRIVQYDNDGKSRVYGPFSIDNSTNPKKIIKLINISGQEISEAPSTGTYIEVYDDGTMKKIRK